jgi:hypothetical protein
LYLRGVRRDLLERRHTVQHVMSVDRLHHGTVVDRSITDTKGFSHLAYFRRVP